MGRPKGFFPVSGRFAKNFPSLSIMKLASPLSRSASASQFSSLPFTCKFVGVIVVIEVDRISTIIINLVELSASDMFSRTAISEASLFKADSYIVLSLYERSLSTFL